MTEPTQENSERVPSPEAHDPPKPADPEPSISEDLLDLRENLERDPSATRHINFFVFGLYTLVLIALLAASVAVWKNIHHF